jgi:hypothetical protein
VERLLRAAPETRVDARLYPPSFVALVDEARERLRALGVRRLTVEAQPEARVFVEGRELGLSPVALDLPPGRYRVVGLRGGIRTPAVVVEVAGEDRAVQLDMSLVEAFRPEAGPGLALLAGERAGRVQAAAARLGLDRVVAVGLLQVGGQPFAEAALHDARLGTVVREGRVGLTRGAAPAGALDALADYLLTGRGSPLVETAGGPSLLPEAPAGARLDLADPPALQRRRALTWGAIGTGAASGIAGGAAALLGLQASSRYDEARGMLGPDGRVQPPHSVAQYNAAVQGGDASRRTAIGLGIGAGVGAAVTAWLAWLAGHQEAGPPAEGPGR